MKISVNIFKIAFIRRLPIFVFILFLLSTLQFGCRTFSLDSNWRNSEIIIDGKTNDWLGSLMYFEEDNISIGLKNDANYMYICMIAEDQRIRIQMMRQGLTLWFDSDAKKKKNFGIKFPVGMQMLSVDRQRGERDTDRENSMRSQGRERDPNQEMSPEAFQRALSRLEILGPGKDVSKRMSVKDAGGIEVKLEASSGMFVYELKLPLSRSKENPFAIGTEAGSSIGIGLEIPKMDRNAVRSPMSGRGGGMPGGSRGGAGGMTGGRGLRSGGGRQEIQNGLKIWAVVKLASE